MGKEVRGRLLYDRGWVRVRTGERGLEEGGSVTVGGWVRVIGQGK